MKRREFMKFLGGGSLALTFPALSEPIKGVDPVPEVAANLLSLTDIKNAIACLEKNKCQPIRQTGGYVFYADPDLVDSFVDDDILGSMAVKRNQNYLNLRKSRW